MRILLTVLLVIVVTGCEEVPPPEPVPSFPAVAARPKPASATTIAPRVRLDWESGHPDRAVWSAALISDLNAHFSSFSKASDAGLFCAQWSSLTRDQQVNVLADMIVWTAFYESAWNPTDSSVDVGSATDANTWSVGLLQLSVVDQANYHLPFGYSVEDLQDPIKNLHLGVAIMATQIDRHRKILIPAGESGVYWGTLHPGGKYDKSAAIEAHTRASTFSAR